MNEELAGKLSIFKQGRTFVGDVMLDAWLEKFNGKYVRVMIKEE